MAERRDAEPTGAEAPSPLDLILAAGRLGSWDWHVPSGRVTFGGAWAAMLGLAPGEIEPHVRAWERLLHPDDAGRVMQVLNEHLEGRTAYYECEHRLRHRDGTWRWILDRGRVVERDAQGRALRAVGTHADVTEAHLQREQDLAERRQAEEALRESESFYRQTLESIPGMTFTTRPDGYCDYVSEQWIDYTGLPAPAHLGDRWIDTLHPDDRSPTFATWRAAVEGRGRYDLEYRLRHRDGRYEWFKVRGRAIRDAHGTVVRWIGTAMNVDGLKRTEAELIASREALRDGEARLRQIIDSMYAFVGVMSSDGTLVEANRAPIEAAGIARSDVIGRPFWDCWWWTHDEAVRERVRAACLRALGGELMRFDETIRVANDQRMTIDLLLQPVVEAGRVKYVIPSAVDVTARRAAEDRLLQADRRKDEFLATLSHELRNPLAPIRTAAQVLANPQLQPQQLAWAQGVIQRQVRHMALLLDDLLDVARITQNKLALRRERVSLATLVDGAVESARPLIDAKHHRLVVQLPDEPPMLHADPLRASQILANLLTNAAKYTESGGRIELTAGVEGGSARITVRDDGIGIPAAALAGIFTMFSQVDGGSERAEGGLGIGLALVKGLVELHGGTVEARSGGTGHGSEFTVRLPLADEHATRADEGATDTAPPPPRPRRVLIADDNVDAADSLALLLQLQGNEVRVARDGRAALTVAQAFRPDVAVLDIGMPGLDGYQLARALRAEAWATGMRLIALTGWGQQEDKQRARDAGFDHHLTKPVDPGVLETLVAGAATEGR